MSKEQINKLDELAGKVQSGRLTYSTNLRAFNAAANPQAVRELITMLRAKDEALMKAREFLVFAWVELGMSEYTLNKLNDTIAAVDAAQGKQRVGGE